MKFLIVLLFATSALAGIINSSNFVKVKLEEPPQDYVKSNLVSKLSRVKRSIGEDANLGQFPFVAELVIKFNSKTTTDLCTGALISKDWIITALQCIRNVTSGETLKWMDVYLGDVVSDPTSNSRKSSYAKFAVWIYPENEFPNHEDIALIQTSVAYENSNFIRPINLPKTADDDYTNAEFSLVGWSYINAEGTRTPNKVRFINLTIDLTPNDCFVTDFYFCSTLTDVEFEADLGSPYVLYDIHGNDILIGVQSGKTASAVFGTVISKLLSFINQHV